MSIERKVLDWKLQKELSLDPSKFDNMNFEEEKPCTMCGDYCSMKIFREYF